MFHVRYRGIVYAGDIEGINESNFTSIYRANSEYNWLKEIGVEEISIYNDEYKMTYEDGEWF